MKINVVNLTKERKTNTKTIIKSNKIKSVPTRLNVFAVINQIVAQ